MLADLALINANIRTMNPNQPLAQAIAISGNKIVKVGTNREINQLIGKNTQVISLEGKTVVPGLIDTHVHAADFGRCLLWLDLTSVQSISQLHSLLKDKAKHTPVGKWIIGQGWNEERFEEQRMPTIADLDEAAQDHPVILYREAAMVCITNTAALKLAGVTNQTAVPTGGTVGKNPQTDELTGVFRDTATNLVWQAVPEPSETELLDATSLACKKIAVAGLTSIHWLVISESELSIIQKLHTQGRLPIRINVVVPEALLEKTVCFKTADTSMLHLGGVFIAVDGYLDSKTAALSQPYSDDATNSGTLLYKEQALATSVQKVLASGLQTVIHAMGDKAIETALKVIEQTRRGNERFRIEQAAVLNEKLIQRLKAANIVVSVQPKVITTEFAVWSATQRLGVRAKMLHPLKTLLNEGVKIAGGSDCPMEPLSPLLGMQEAVLRESFSEQRLSVEEALRMYTLDAAYSSCEENVKGSIEKGKLADLTVLTSDPNAVEPDKIKDISIDMVIVNGRILTG